MSKNKGSFVFLIVILLVAVIAFGYIKIRNSVFDAFADKLTTKLQESQYITYSNITVNKKDKEIIVRDISNDTYDINIKSITFNNFGSINPVVDVDIVMNTNSSCGDSCTLEDMLLLYSIEEVSLKGLNIKELDKFAKEFNPIDLNYINGLDNDILKLVGVMVNISEKIDILYVNGATAELERKSDNFDIKIHNYKYNDPYNSFIFAKIKNISLSFNSANKNFVSDAINYFRDDTNDIFEDIKSIGSAGINYITFENIEVNDMLKLDIISFKNISNSTFDFDFGPLSASIPEASITMDPIKIQGLNYIDLVDYGGQLRYINNDFGKHIGVDSMYPQIGVKGFTIGDINIKYLDSTVTLTTNNDIKNSEKYKLLTDYKTSAKLSISLGNETLDLLYYVIGPSLIDLLPKDNKPIVISLLSNAYKSKSSGDINSYENNMILYDYFTINTLVNIKGLPTVYDPSKASQVKLAESFLEYQDNGLIKSLLSDNNISHEEKDNIAKEILESLDDNKLYKLKNSSKIKELIADFINNPGSIKFTMNPNNLELASFISFIYDDDLVASKVTDFINKLNISIEVNGVKESFNYIK